MSVLKFWDSEKTLQYYIRTKLFTI